MVAETHSRAVVVRLLGGQRASPYAVYAAYCIAGDDDIYSHVRWRLPTDQREASAGNPIIGLPKADLPTRGHSHPPCKLRTTTQPARLRPRPTLTLTPPRTHHRLARAAQQRRDQSAVRPVRGGRRVQGSPRKDRSGGSKRSKHRNLKKPSADNRARSRRNHSRRHSRRHNHRRDARGGGGRGGGRNLRV